MWVTIWVCIKAFRNKAGLTCKGGGDGASSRRAENSHP
jgi:hypothetical protein